jgi:LAO/AO transport system kinase
MTQHGRLRVLTLSALEDNGITALWDTIKQHQGLMQDSGLFDSKRSAQRIRWMYALLDDMFYSKLKDDAETGHLANSLEDSVQALKLDPMLAAQKLAKAIGLL